MIRNVLGAALAIAALLPATTADAAKKPPRPCLDPANDVRLTRSGPVVDAPYLDLRSADLALGREVVSIAFRVTQLTTDEGLWKATWQSGKQSYYAVAAISAVTHPLDPDSAYGFRGGVVGGKATSVYGRLDFAKNEIRIELRRRDLRGLRTVSGLAVQARRPLGNADVALVDFLAC